MKRNVFIAICALAVGSPVQAQFTVHDAAVTARNAASAVLKEYILNTQREQHSQLRRMAQRLSLHTNLRKYAVEDPPRWRTHGGDFLFASGFNDALIFGDPVGAAYLAVSHALTHPRSIPGSLTPAARRELTARLATVDLADASAIAGIHDTGQLRLNGRRRELQAINALEAHVIDPSNEQSATVSVTTVTRATRSSLNISRAASLASSIDS
jgi:hypothetical protein